MDIAKITKKITKLKNQQAFLKYFKNTSLVLGEKVLQLLSGILIGIWVARYLGVSNFGTLSYVISISALFTSFTTLGLNEIVVKELLSKKKSQTAILKTSFFLMLIASCCSLALFSIWVISFPEFFKESYFIFIAISASIFLSFNVIELFFRSKVNSAPVVKVRIVALLFSVIFRVIFIYFEAGLNYFVFLILFNSFFIAMCMCYIYLKHRSSTCQEAVDTAVGNLGFYLLSQSWPFIISGIFISLYMKIDQAMIGYMLGLHDVGLYAAAARLSELWYFIPATIVMSLLPAIIKAKNSGKVNYESLLEYLYLAMIMGALIISIIMSFFSENIVLLIYGKEFQDASAVLTIHVWSSVFIFFNIIFSQWILIEGLQRLKVYIDLVAVIVNIFLNLLLIPIWGVSGAAIATLLSYCIPLTVLCIMPSPLQKGIRIGVMALLLPIRKNRGTA